MVVLSLYINSNNVCMYLLINMYKCIAYYYLWEYSHDSGEIARNTALYWVGSIINSLIVLLFGTLVGEWHEAVHVSVIFNFLFVAVPLLYAKRVLQQSRTADKPTAGMRLVLVI